jgi:superfamily II DNA or RNA helicase
MSLRFYQQNGKDQTREQFQLGKRRVLLCIPTGGGKTVTFADMARDAVLNNIPVMVVVDRKELLEQAKDKLIEYGLSPQIITAGRTVRLGKNCYVATVQTLKKRSFPEIGLIIVDEAHKQIFDDLYDLEQYKDSYFILATATPKRTGKMRQLHTICDVIVEPVTITELISLGFLVPAITFGAKMDTSKIKTKGDDFDVTALYDAFNKTTLYAGVVDKYRKYADGTKAIVFCVNVEHSRNTVQAFNNAGYNAVHVDGKTSKNEREAILKAFRMGIYTHICNVGILTTGYDEWTIETVIINLATKSLSLFLQMAGRGSRITPQQFQDIAGYLQKTHFNLIDMGGNIHNHGFWESEREWKLEHKTKEALDAAPVKECDEFKQDINDKFGCGALTHLSAVKCKNCGWLFPIKQKETPKEVEFDQLENHDFLPPEFIGKSWGIMTIPELEQVAKLKGYKQGWVITQILLNKNLRLIDYATMKNYPNPRAWAEMQEKIRKPKDKPQQLNA